MPSYFRHLQSIIILKHFLCYLYSLKGVSKLYKCYKFKKILKLILCDSVIILFALIVTFAGRNTWKAYNENEERVFLPIIMYHSIVDDNSSVNGYTVTPEIVENDLKYLSENGYEAIFTEDLINYVNGGTLPEKPVIITADDGFYNNTVYLLPLLKKYDMKAVISIVGYYTEVIAEADPHIPRYSYLTWDDISEINKSGYIEIGNHTYNMHFDKGRKGCSKLSSETYEEYADALIDDIGLCQTLLSLNCSITPAVFAYPFGSISKESIPILKTMGFAAAFSCYERPNYITRSPDTLFTLDRYNRSGNISTEEFMKKLLKE